MRLTMMYLLQKQKIIARSKTRAVFRTQFNI